MRWMWIDRFTEFHAGRRAVAIKNVSIVEEQMDDYLPGFPMMPSSLILEGLAQTSGLLVAEHGGFLERVVLAKVGKAVFYRPAVPGDRLTYTAEVEVFQPDGAICKCTSHIEGQLQAEVDLVFAHLDDRFEGTDLFKPDELLQMVRIFRLYEVGCKPDGSPLSIPPHMLAAEQAVLASGTPAASN
jgi:3-hydroxyacyl-[acyl-carrier-protein] dehydratase